MGHQNLDERLNKIISNSLPLRDVKIGSIIWVTSEDALTRCDGEFGLQLLAFSQELDEQCPRPIFRIIPCGFNFYGYFGEPHGTVSDGALAVGGYAMQWLPQPRMVMVGLLSIDVGRDYNLAWVGGENLQVITHDIRKLRVESIPEFQPPDGIPVFVAGVVETRTRIEAEGKTKDEAQKAEMMARLENLELPADLLKVIGSCSAEGVQECGSFLLTANTQGRLEDAVNPLREAFERHFHYQHPAIRGSLEVGDNRGVFAQLRSGLNLGPQIDLGDNPTPRSQSDREIRAILEAEIDPKRFQQRETAVISQLSVGDLVVAETASGNKYALLIIDPKTYMVRVLQLKIRPGFESQGVLGDMLCADLEVGLPINADGLSSTRVVRLYQSK